MNARKRWRLSLLGLAVVLAGCQGNAKAYRYIETLNAERRALEDRVYALEDDLDALDTELSEVLSENDELRRELGKDSKPTGRRSAPPARRAPAGPAAPSTPSRRDPPAAHELVPPTIDSGEPDEPDAPAEEPNGPRLEPAPKTSQTGEADSPAELLIPPPPSTSQGAKRTSAEGKLVATSATLATNDRRVVRIALDPARSGGADFDGRRGDDGVSIVLQPKNDAGQIVLDPAAISVAVLDPNRPADQSRVARWDLDAQQVKKLAEDPTTNRGWKLHFAWPEQPPSSSLLRLYVRYTTEDGQHFDTEQEIHIELAEGARGGKPGWRAER